MPNFITRKELEAIASYIYCLNEDEDSAVRLSIEVEALDGEILGWIHYFDDEDPGYAFRSAV